MRQNDEKCDAWISGFRIRLRNRMDYLGMNTKTLSIISGIEYALIRQYLNSKVVPSAYHAAKLAKALVMSTDDLITPVDL